MIIWNKGVIFKVIRNIDGFVLYLKSEESLRNII